MNSVVAAFKRIVRKSGASTVGAVFAAFLIATVATSFAIRHARDRYPAVAENAAIEANEVVAVSLAQQLPRYRGGLRRARGAAIFPHIDVVTPARFPGYAMGRFAGPGGLAFARRVSRLSGAQHEWSAGCAILRCCPHGNDRYVVEYFPRMGGNSTGTRANTVGGNVTARIAPDASDMASFTFIQSSDEPRLLDVVDSRNPEKFYQAGQYKKANAAYSSGAGAR